MVRGVRNPKDGVLLGAVSRAMGRRGWKLECACISNVKSYLGAEGDRRGIKRPERDLSLVGFGVPGWLAR